jgi:Hypothetical protein (DUF2513)
MKRDWEMIRSLLLEIERESQFNNQYIFDEKDHSKIEFHQTRRAHLRLMKEAGFIRTMGEMEHYTMGITWTGYEFLDTIRDDEVWSKTKSGAIDVKNFSVEMLKDIAKAYGKKKLKDLTGLEAA